MTELLFMLALVGYLVTAGIRILSGRGPLYSHLADAGLGIGLLAHLAGLAVWAVQAEGLPVHNASGSLAFVASVVASGSMLTRFTARNEVIAGVIVSLAAVMLGTSMLLPSETAPPDSVLASVWFPVHALAVFLGLANFACAFGVSVVYLLVRGRLKNKDFAALGRLPSLEGLDSLNTRFVVAGFLALTLGIAAGGAWAASVGGGNGLGPTVAVTLVLWGWYALAVLVRVVGRWRGRLAAAFSVGGFIGMVTSLGAVMAIMRGWH